MSKKGKIYISLITIAILTIVALEMTKPKNINWFESYALHHNIPLGSVVFKEQLQRISKNINLVERPPFEYLKNNKIKGTYIFYNSTINFGKDELNSLLDWVNNGNTLIVAAKDFEPMLLDTLHLETRSVNAVGNFNNEYQVKLANPRLNNNSFKYDKSATFYHFNKIDTLKTSVIGFIDIYRSSQKGIKDSLVNIVKQPFGDGKIILSTFPQAFTNYFILKTPNHNYTSSLLSYMDTEKSIFLDTYYKSGKKFYTSPMYLFLNNNALKWSYYLILIGVLIYIIFEGKRKQRVIPILTPLKNQTVSFTRTIANMYYEKGKNKDIAKHKIQHFLDYIRNTMYLQTATIDKEFLKNLAARSNNTLENTQALFNFISNIEKQIIVSNDELRKLNTLIDKFKSYNQWKTKQ